MINFLLAHQGGWDEILLVAGPLLFLSLLVWLAARRFKSAELESSSDQSDAEDALSNPRDPIEEPAL